MRWPLAIVVTGLASALGVAGCGGQATADPGVATDETTIVVTYPVLGSLVTELVGDAADVTVLMPNGVDPHEWQPSAKDVETLGSADLVVVNGLGLEEGLDDVLAEVERSGVPVFAATDHVDVRTVGTGEIAEDDHEEGHGEDDDAHGEEHEPGAQDPHIWTDPLAMERVVAALGETLAAQLGLEVGARASELENRLVALDAEIAETLSVVPQTERKLVTGHESMGYFADRYSFELVGAVIPSISSQAEASAGELAELKDLIEREGVPAIFTEVGTPSQVAESIADEAGATVVELPSHNLPDDGSYFTFLRGIATAIADALSP
jgi:zinc/manganese transport system substrate-binding protein